jgi:hypothetical protein
MATIDRMARERLQVIVSSLRKKIRKTVICIIHLGQTSHVCVINLHWLHSRN